MITIERCTKILNDGKKRYNNEEIKHRNRIGGLDYRDSNRERYSQEEDDYYYPEDYIENRQRRNYIDRTPNVYKKSEDQVKSEETTLSKILDAIIGIIIGIVILIIIFWFLTTLSSLPA